MKIHGEWEVSRVRNVVVRAFAGNFNEQGVRAMFEDYKAIAPTGVAWASLAQGEYWEMAPTVALKAYTSMRDWAITHGCQCIAFVCPSRFHLDIVQRNSGIVPGDDFYVCTTTEEACAWLTAKGFPFSMQDFQHTVFLEKAKRTLENDPLSSFFRVA
ncbi:hypothetical protein KDM87_11985 [Undibacterium sp. FT147W]|uniref:Uncharacterized protein n=1 Tax=Undibacterium rivi TaxID=2828729 RepID=A0ABS5H4A2_9BURK|nr:hypothetical protein [Undibacterium rivi]MBR7793320.1 hypothetical protein [Undibacterium rivi]